MTMLMLMAVIYLGTILLFPQKNQDTRSSDELLAKLQEYNRNLQDVTAAQVLPVYLQKLGAEKGPKKWSPEEVERRELLGAFLVADTKYKTAMNWDHDPINQAAVHKKLNDGWLLLQQKFDRIHTKPIWREPIAVAPTPERPETAMTPGTLFDAMVQDLSERNKKDLVWGMVPGYQLIDLLVSITGRTPGFSYWFAPFLLALLVRVLVYPWSKKQYLFSKQMMQLQPYVKEIQEKFRDKKTGQIPPDKQAQASAESMALYKEYGINPMAGCGSAFIQLPFFMIVYSCMQLYRFEFVKGYFAWINPSATTFLGLHLAPNLGQTDQLLIIFYGISMLASQFMMPVSDPTQIKTQRMMGIGMSIFITFIMFSNPLPSSFALYWCFANFLATGQALWAYQQKIAPLEKVQTVKGGIPAKQGFMEKLQSMMEQAAQQQAKQQDELNKGKIIDVQENIEKKKPKGKSGAPEFPEKQ